MSTLSEWEDYNETLAQVLTWLLQAETQLKQQTPVSEKVDIVKEQFREHEVSNELVYNNNAIVSCVSHLIKLKESQPPHISLALFSKWDGVWLFLRDARMTLLIMPVRR